MCELDRYGKFVLDGQVGEDGLITRLCTTCRDLDWAKDKDDKLSAVLKELKRIFALIIIDTENEDILGALKNTLNERQTIEPKEIIVATTKGSVAKASEFMAEYVKGTETKYFVRKVFDAENKRELIDSVVKCSEAMFYTVIENGQTIPNDSLELIHLYIDSMLKKVAFIPGYLFNGMTVLRAFHVMVNGNFSSNIEDKFQEAFDNEGTQSLMKTWTELRKEVDEYYRAHSKP